MRVQGKTDRVLEAFKKHGPMTRRQAEEMAGLGNGEAASMITRMLAPQKNGMKRMHIHSWVRDEEGNGVEKIYKPVYAFGDKPDAPCPYGEKVKKAEKNMTLEEVLKKSPGYLALQIVWGNVVRANQ